MYTWKSAIFVAATLLVGCTGEIAEPPGEMGGPSPGPNNPGQNPSTSTPPGGTTNPGNPSTPPTTGTGNPTTPPSSAGDPGTAPTGTGNPLPPSTPPAPAEPISPPTCTPEVAPTSQIPRLTGSQYDRTIRDLLGVTTLNAANGVAPSTLLATDQSGGMTDLAWANYKAVAEMIAAQVMADPTLRANFLKCTPTAGDDTCLNDTIVSFGRRAFRRALTPEEVTRFQKVVADGPTITENGTPDEIAEVLLYMFLISPSFLQRAEIVEAQAEGGRYALSSHEIASRLSYMIWGSMPDPELDQAADQGLLSTPQEIAQQAQRMLQDPKAKDMVEAFNKYYLLMNAEGRWGTAQRDPSLFPMFKPEMVPAITEETLRFFEKVTFTPGATFQDLFLSPVAFVNKDTAALYGLDPSQYGTELTEVTLDANQRPGFLTRLGFLANFSSYNRTNPIYRGAFITKQVLGISVPPPPPGAADTALPISPDLDTNRKQVEAQTSGDECVSCHSLYVNPPGFVMESFDAIGAYRTTEANGVPLDTQASVVIEAGKDPVLVSTPAELMALIASSPSAIRQYASKWVSFAYQREGHPADACTSEQLAAKISAGNYSVLTLISDLTQTESFRFRAVEVAQ